MKKKKNNNENDAVRCGERSCGDGDGMGRRTTSLLVTHVIYSLDDHSHTPLHSNFSFFTLKKKNGADKKK